MMPAIVNHEQRRAASTANINDQIQDLLDLTICTNGQLSAYEFLFDMITWMLEQGEIDDSCDALKAVILPKLQHCVLETTGITHTIYAGVVFDAGLIFSISGVRGVYIDSDGRMGCFSTECGGFGLNIGVGVGAVGGLLLGDAVNDFPGVGYGGEFGGDLGAGIDFAGGFTSGGKLYAEISGGVGVGVSLGVQNCNTETDGESWAMNDYKAEGDMHCGGNKITQLADGTVNGWAPPNASSKLCQVRCTNDPTCEAFVWRDSDRSCFWKEDVLTTSRVPQAGHTCFSRAWMRANNRHCGGEDVNPLADGTAYGWAPPSKNKELCEAKCNDDAQCVGFVYKDADNKCYWKKGVTRDTLTVDPGHHCYHRVRGMLKESGMHCGGSNVSPLADGTVYGWVPPSQTPSECETKCQQDAQCEAFVWRSSDKRCYWKKHVSASSLTSNPGHDCYSSFTAPNAAAPSPAPAPAPAPVSPPVLVPGRPIGCNEPGVACIGLPMPLRRLEVQRLPASN